MRLHIVLLVNQISGRPKVLFILINNNKYINIKFENFMKKITLLLALCAFIFNLNAQVLYDETFNYAVVPGPVNGQGGWTESGGVHPNGEGRTIVFPPLSYSDGAGNWALSSMGNSFYMYDITKATADNYVYKPFTSTPINSGIVYLSFLFQVAGNISSTNTEIFGLADGTSAGPKVMIKRVGSSPYTTFNMGVTRGAASTSAYKFGTTVCNNLTTYFIVMKYDFSNQTASVFLNPALASASEPATPEIIDNNSATIRTQLSNMWNRNQSTWGNFYVSGVRVSRSWSAAVGLPATPLAFPTNVNATSVSNSQFMANWTPVANASGYEIAVYDGTTQVKSIEVTGQNTSSVGVTGLKSNTAYTFTVIAKGDGINFASSGASLAVSLSTLGLSAPTVADATAITDNSFTANWTTVSSAVGYDVLLYLGKTLVSTTTVDGQASVSHVFSSIKAGTTYKYAVIAKGDGIVNQNSTSSTTVSATTTFPATNSVNTDFGDGTWGTITPTPTTNLPANGMYSSGSINGFTLTACEMYGLMSTGPKGEEHLNVIRMDKSSFGASVALPMLNAVARIEIHISGSDLKTFFLKQWNAGTSTWDLVGPGNGAGIGTYTISGSLENVFSIDLNISSPVQLRIDNGSTSSLSIAKIATYATMPTTVDLPAPTGIGAATNLIAGGFTASWTPVVNALGYQVTVLNYGKYLHKTFAVDGQATSSYNVTGLDSANVCTYQVSAVGDGIAYSNSALSVASPSFVITSGILAVQNPSESTILSIYGKNIVSSETGAIEIFNLQGSLMVHANNVNSLKTILSTGLYIVRFTSKTGQIHTQKILFQ